jgi:carboxyl-terminal processing protease
MNLLARGVFFKFATNYYNTTDSLTKRGISQDELFNKFMKYLETQEYEYTSKVENLTNQLKTEAEEESYDGEVSKLIDGILSEILKAKKRELVKYKDDILAQINEEIAARKNGRKGRIEESLKYDKQFASAVSIMKDSPAYKRLLQKSE